MGICKYNVPAKNSKALNDGGRKAKAKNNWGIKMKKLLSIIFFIIYTFRVFPNAVIAGEYVLGPRDVISISVLGFEELQLKELIIRDDGRIAFPLAGEIQVNGLTPGSLSQKITDVLQDYINSPTVTVNVVKFRTNRVYVLGEVARPGVYELEKEHRLLDAIGIAGSYTKEAAKKKVFIIHKDNSGKPLEADLLRLLKTGDMTQNYLLEDGDVVYLSNNKRIDIARDILPYVNTFFYVKDVNND